MMDAVPHKDIEFGPLDRSHEDLCGQIRKICKIMIPEWSDIDDESGFEISVISGGISNALFKVAPNVIIRTEEDASECRFMPVAFRVYGYGTDNFIDREKELRLMITAFENGFGPRLVATFKDGRIESFLNKRSLTPDEMSNEVYAPHIARALARFHAISIPEDGQNSKEYPRTPFQRVRDWLNIVSTLDFSDDPTKAKAIAAFDLTDLRKEVDEIETVANLLRSPSVLAHNDLLSGNIMINPSSSTTHRDLGMTFIDFEYADAAPRGYDIGNHFNEYAGFDCDYSKYPMPEAAQNFIRAYLAAVNNIDITDLTDLEVEHGVIEANLFALASHQYWGTWSLMQARWSQIDFDYVEYAALRWKEYRKRKNEFVEAALKMVSRN